MISVYRHAHLAGVVRETALLWTANHPPTHAHPWAWLQGELLMDAGTALLSFTFFLLGLYVWRKGVLQESGAWRPRLARLCRWTLPLGLVAHLVTGICKMHPKYNSVAGMDWALTLFTLFGMPVLACGYATLLALLSTSERWRPKVAWLAPVGRMALTNYLMQSVVCVAFYSGILTGLYGRVGPAWDWVATLTLYSVQVAWSHWWLDGTGSVRRSGCGARLPMGSGRRCGWGEAACAGGETPGWLRWSERVTPAGSGRLFARIGPV